MFVFSTLLTLLATTSALTLPTATKNKRGPDECRSTENYNAGNCVFYWVPYLLENTPMNIEMYDAQFNPICTDNTTHLPSWANHQASVPIIELDRPCIIQSQDFNLPAMFVYGDNTHISLDPHHLSPINTTLGQHGDMPNPGTCSWPLPNDDLKPGSTNLMKCTFSCGDGY